ncbi:MAG: CAP domain-containing protein [Angelakisella sp.]|jgi:uncharacterized protein YkwD|nr:CAP domain-containing protein [Angelakisella sp.]
MSRGKKTLAFLLALCLLSACGGRRPPFSQSSQSQPPVLPAAQSPAEESAPPLGPEEAPGTEEAPEPETTPPEPVPPEETGPSSSQPELIPSSQETESAPEPSEPPPGEPSQPGEEETGPPESCPPPEESEPLPDGCQWLNITEASVLGFINRERGKKGLTPLTLDGDLTAAARIRAGELYRGNYVAHTRPGGAPWETVLAEIPVDYVRAGENLAWSSHGLGEEIGAFQWFNLWKESPGHYRAMMEEQYTSCGVAVLTGPYYDEEDQSYAVAIFCTY